MFCVHIKIGFTSPYESVPATLVRGPGNPGPEVGAPM